MTNSNESFQNSFDQSVSEAPDWQRENLDAFIIRYFGSAERAKEIAKYYVIEEEPISMEFDELYHDPYTYYRFTHTYKIRPKTPEELAHDRAEEILEKNTRKICIVCKEPIDPDELVDSRHGPYHNYCTSGHP